MRVVAIALAGGAATRFGADKLNAVLDGRPLLHHALEACAAVAPSVVLVLAPDAPVPPLPSALEPRIVVARDPTSHLGPLAGLAAGLATASMTVANADIAIVVGGDMPALRPDVLELLIERLAAPPAAPGAPRPDAAIIEAEPAATLPMAVRIPAAIGAARSLLDADRRSLRGLLDRLPHASVEAATWRALDPDGRTISDIDTLDDLTAARDRRP